MLGFPVGSPVSCRLVSHRAMVGENRLKLLTLGYNATMALDQRALLELLGELKLTDVSDRIRVATETLYQELIDAESGGVRDGGLCPRRLNPHG